MPQRAPSREKMDQNLLVLLPFVDHILVVLLMAVLAPGVWAVSLLARKELFQGGVLLAAWGALYCGLAYAGHKRGIVRLWFSIGGGVVVLAAASLVLFHI